MSKPSNWPLHESSVRQVVPTLTRKRLSEHPLAMDCFPLAVGLYENAIGHGMSRPSHDDNLIIYCFNGLGHVETEHWSGAVEAGSIVMLPAGVAHSYKADDEQPWSIYWCHFSGNASTHFMDLMDYEPLAPTHAIEPVHNVLGQFKKLLAANNSGYNDTNMVYSANLLREVLTHLASCIARTERAAGGFDIDAVQAYMQSNLSEALNLNEMAALANLSKFHFCKRYKAITGSAPHTHFLDMKAEYACYLLETSNLSIQQIALRLGYEDNLYFSRMFKRRRGVSPKQYRAML